MNEDQLENPVLGYVVIAVALVVGMLSATVFGQGAGHQGMEKLSAVHPKTSAVASTVKTHRGDPLAANPSSAAKFHTPANRQSTSPVRGSNGRDDASRHWILGVRSTPTAAGCVVSDVLPGSAAQRCGLVAGDRILTVGGQQVGWLGDRLIRLDQAVDSAPSRQTRLLVQRRGSGVIQPVRVTLQTLFECLGH
ncbi:zinc metallopeptidase RseP [Stieleria neptunia]|uniref:Zinc metallopeptidase RseP n=1 Tax=Stieleria neptunia TaxID=2527979 RepID=A0A518HLL8_9BACT|nr:PDZ domain-containing protein [Stieleria neptunia]QDV41736.1 zinc metallopeptidase RseP [Stieleria neptunia]